MKSRAFTLIEMLAVLVVVAILVGLVLSISGHASRAARKARAHAQLEDIADALQDYFDRRGVYPESLVAITNDLPPEFQFHASFGTPLDPWNIPYAYVTNSQFSYRLFSYGPEGTNAAVEDYLVLGK